MYVHVAQPLDVSVNEDILRVRKEKKVVIVGAADLCTGGIGSTVMDRIGGTLYSRHSPALSCVQPQRSRDHGFLIPLAWWILNWMVNDI